MSTGLASARAPTHHLKARREIISRLPGAQDMEHLKREMARLMAPLTPDPRVAAMIEATLQMKTLRKGEHLSREGDVVNAVYFVRSGILRYYYLADGVEHTGQFFGEGMFTSDVFSVATGAPSLQNFDALTPAEVIIIPKAALNAAYASDHAFERFGRRVIEEAMAGSQRRTASLLKAKPEERYAAFAKRRPEIARNVPQYLIASYLGVTPEALSRIRRRRATRKAKP